jgi:uncharacterized protein (DUF2147 family)
MLTLSLAAALLTTAAQAVAQTAPSDAALSPVGVWITVDDTTHKPKALIDITQLPDGKLSGKLLTGLGEDHKPHKRCTACTDERKGQLLQGMNIIRDLTRNGDMWENGKILDPENGKEYHARMNLTDEGQKLVVRGYIGIPLIGRSQTWLREPHPDAARAAAAADAQVNAQGNMQTETQ